MAPYHTAVKRLGRRAIYALPVTSGHFPVSSQISTVKLRHSSLSVLSPIILPLQKFFSRVLLLRQQAFSSGNLPPERPTTTTTAIKTQVFMFRYERVNSTRKFTIVVEIVSLLKKIYKRDAPFRAVFKVKTLAVLFPPYPREMKTNTAKFNLPPFCRLLFCIEMQTHSHARFIARAWLKHAHSFDRCEAPYSFSTVRELISKIARWRELSNSTNSRARDHALKCRQTWRPDFQNVFHVRVAWIGSGLKTFIEWIEDPT